MTRTRIVRILISIFGILLGFWLTFGGLELRIFGSYLRWHQQIAALSYPEHLFRQASLDVGGVSQLAWPMVVFGSSWGGALVGFWIGERWSVPAMILLSVLALPFPYLGTVLAALLLLLLTTPAARQADQSSSDAG